MQKKRKPLSKKARFAVFMRDGFKCRYCGQMPPSVVLEVDHIMPFSKGGSDDQENLITACFSCNRGKSDTELSSAQPSMSDKVEQMKELRAQLNALKRLQREISKIEELGVDSIESIFTEFFPSWTFANRFRATVRTFLSRLPQREVEQAMYLACERMDNTDRAIRYFCGICWNKIKGAE